MDVHEFQFEEDQHVYRDGRGIVRPSVTQALSMAGIFDFSMVPPDVLENARRRGTNVHRYTAEFDRSGDLDPTWLLEDELPYYEAWLKFRSESGCKIVEIEQPMMKTVAGIVVGGTPDRVAFFGANKYVLDLKCCSSSHPGWALQTALYAMMLTDVPHTEYMGRMSVQLFPTGNYKTIVYDNPFSFNFVYCFSN